MKNRSQKKVIVEGRCTISRKETWIPDEWREWHYSRRYLTIEIAKMAIDQLNSKSIGIWEYRLKPDVETFNQTLT